MPNNIGAFGENFPYSNQHDMNMDWIIKIAKDFLDQYTTLQQTITDGLESLENKATELEGLLQEWYDTHSEDIANQLANALSELNEWYTEHQNYLNGYVSDSIAYFNQMADAKTAQSIASIPADYTSLATDVRFLSDALDLQEEERVGTEHAEYLYSINTHSLINIGNAIYNCTKYEINENREYYLTASIRAGDPYYPLIAYVDANDNPLGYQWLNSQDQVYSVTHTAITIPSGTKYCYVNSMNNTGKLEYQSTTVDNLEYAVSYLDYGERIKEGTKYSGYLFSIDTDSLLNIGTAIYNCTKYEIDEDRLYYLTSSIRASDPYYPLIVYVDNNENVLGYQWLNTLDQVYTITHKAITIPSGTKYCYVNSMNNTGTLYYVGTTIDELEAEIKNIHNMYYVGENLTGENTFTTIRKASEYIRDNNVYNATVRVYAGLYDLTEELADVIGSNYDGNRYNHGIQFGYNTHWIFSDGAYLKFNYNGSNADIANLFSPLVIRGSCELENMNIEVGNCQYCVHDDWYNRESNWIVKYKNCIMKHNGNTLGTYRDTVCIGGGLLPEEIVEIDGGVFECPSSFNYPIAYHSIYTNLPEVHPSKLILKNIWLSGTFRLQDAPWYCNDIETIITNCSMNADISGIHTFFIIKKWNNEIRN